MPNGVVRLYQVGYYRTEEGDVDPEAQQVNTTSTNIELSGLNFYTNYTIFVQAFTIAFGPTSDAITILTDEDGKCSLMCDTVKCQYGSFVLQLLPLLVFRQQ